MESRRQIRGLGINFPPIAALAARRCKCRNKFKENLAKKTERESDYCYEENAIMKTTYIVVRTYSDILLFG